MRVIIKKTRVERATKPFKLKFKTLDEKFEIKGTDALLKIYRNQSLNPIQYDLIWGKKKDQGTGLAEL